MQQTTRQSSTTSLPFAGVTKELAARLQAEAEGLVQHHMRAYEAHVYQLRREELRDPALWARVQSSKRGGFSVYRRVRLRRKQSLLSSSSSGGGRDALPTQLLGVGFAVGTVEDMLFGASALSTAAVKIQSLYTQDPVVDAAVLATLQAPSAGDPLRSVTLKWVMKKPKMYGALVVRAAATRLLRCCPGFMRVAETNKLIFALQQDALANAGVSRPPPRRVEDPSSCNVCLKSLGLCKRGRPCQLCNQLCCSSCLVLWKTNFALTALGGSSILEKRLRFCRSCIIMAQSANPLAIAASRLS
ncbi:hypothetical protein PybrP1_006601 [[Pythium] brassicae (nom. inval.)]|nr:hypothetical protein PybrP1_006601 [[Pythium] brassicae (nom. inval.)]